MSALECTILSKFKGWFDFICLGNQRGIRAQCSIGRDSSMLIACKRRGHSISSPASLPNAFSMHHSEELAGYSPIILQRSFQQIKWIALFPLRWPLYKTQDLQHSLAISVWNVLVPIEAVFNRQWCSRIFAMLLSYLPSNGNYSNLLPFNST